MKRGLKLASKRNFAGISRTSQNCAADTFPGQSAAAQNFAATGRSGSWCFTQTVFPTNQGNFGHESDFMSLYVVSQDAKFRDEMWGVHALFSYGFANVADESVTIHKVSVIDSEFPKTNVFSKQNPTWGRCNFVTYNKLVEEGVIENNEMTVFCVLRTYKFKLVLSPSDYFRNSQICQSIMVYE